jgi:hypothetical protein
MHDVAFRSKVDWWLVAVLVISAAVALITVLTVGVAAPLASAAIVLLGIGLPMWVLLATTYTLTAAHLNVRSGPFTWRIPLNEIRSVAPTRNPLSSPALSLDRLRIEYGHGKAIMISPAAREEFMQELRRRVPNV